MQISLYDYCAAFGRPDLLSEWDSEKNAPLTPEAVTRGTRRKVWWRCGKGHEWQAEVRHRTEGVGCPYCANYKMLPGYNDLATTHPELAKQWHPSKNGPLTPGGITAGKEIKVWWMCEKGHEWQATVVSRARGAGCPVCAGRVVIPGENDLASCFPDIAAQWHPTKNEGLSPDQVFPYANRRVWWRCPLGHEYRTKISTKVTEQTGCPYCSGQKVLKGFNDLATVNPKVAAQWHPTLNGILTPEMVTAGSNKKAWWLCPEGHVWKALIQSRAGARKYGCPVCSGRVKPERARKYAGMVYETKMRRPQAGGGSSENDFTVCRADV